MKLLLNRTSNFGVFFFGPQFCDVAQLIGDHPQAYSAKFGFHI